METVKKSLNANVTVRSRFAAATEVSLSEKVPENASAVFSDFQSDDGLTVCDPDGRVLLSGDKVRIEYRDSADTRVAVVIESSSKEAKITRNLDFPFVMSLIPGTISRGSLPTEFGDLDYALYSVKNETCISEEGVTAVLSYISEIIGTDAQSVCVTVEAKFCKEGEKE